MDSDTSKPILVTALNTDLTVKGSYTDVWETRGNESMCNSPGEK